MKTVDAPLRLHFTCLAPPNIVDEVVNTFVLAACRLGHDVTQSRGEIRDDSINVVCFALGLDPLALQGRTNCILLNFEPLAPGSQAHNKPYLDLLRNNYVWDYSATNLKLYPALGIARGYYVPLGFEAEADVTLDLSDRLPEAEKDIDVLFFGGPNERRERVIAGMRGLGLNVVTNGNTLWEPAHRNALIRRAKAVLNMHRYDNFRVAEMPRLAMLLRQRKAVVCELYPDTEIFPELRDAVAGARYDGLVQAACDLVRDPDRRDALERRGLDLLRQHSQADLLRPALAHFSAKPA